MTPLGEPFDAGRDELAGDDGIDRGPGRTESVPARQGCRPAQTAPRDNRRP
ncbi:hypothetical protein [Actinoplanes sp. URMC 104]|uniref:hypothetical protein n=1 Tax=Actinoplanes sp. URMC 104 TaxID=3423409 RepID=UPI003F1A504E